jgi:hypothetical protein
MKQPGGFWGYAILRQILDFTIIIGGAYIRVWFASSQPQESRGHGEGQDYQAWGIPGLWGYGNQLYYFLGFL